MGPCRSSALSVGRFASPNPGSVNAYWIDAPEGFVVDAGRNVTGGEKIAEEISRTGQPVGGDPADPPSSGSRWGTGGSVREVPGHTHCASEATAKWIRDDPLGFYPLARGQADSDYPETVTYPTETLGP